MSLPPLWLFAQFPVAKFKLFRPWHKIYVAVSGLSGSVFDMWQLTGAASFSQACETPGWTRRSCSHQDGRIKNTRNTNLVLCQPLTGHLFNPITSPIFVVCMFAERRPGSKRGNIFELIKLGLGKAKFSIIWTANTCFYIQSVFLTYMHVHKHLSQHPVTSAIC